MEQIANNSQVARAIESIKWLKKVKVLKIIFRFYSEWDIKFGARQDNPRPMEIIYVEPISNKVQHFKPYCDFGIGYSPSLIEWIYKGKNTDF